MSNQTPTVIVKVPSGSYMATFFFLVPKEKKYEKLVCAGNTLDKMLAGGILTEITADNLMDRFSSQAFKELIEFAHSSKLYEFKVGERK